MPNLKLVHSAPAQPPSPPRRQVTPQYVGLTPVHNRIECCGEPLDLNIMFVDMEKSRSLIVRNNVYMQLQIPCIFCYEENSVLFRGNREDLRG